MSSLNNIRRAQLLAPFGPGALHTLKNGISVITGGLDHWYKSNDGPMAGDEQLAEWKIHEWRLERMLGVDHFRLPPEYRKFTDGGGEVTVPLLRFPTWFVCPICGRLDKRQLHTDGLVPCPREECKKTKMVQVRFVAACDHGHILDFPWNEWVHRNKTPDCRGPLHYRAVGAGSLRDIKIECRGCNISRSLENVMQASPDRTRSYLSSNLERPFNTDEESWQGSVFGCSGQMPWLGTEQPGVCGLPIQAVLINATNVHYAEIRSSIFLPVELAASSQAAEETLRSPGPLGFLNLTRDAMSPELCLETIKKKYPDDLSDFEDGDLLEAIHAIWELPSVGEEDPVVGSNDEEDWEQFRYGEYEVLTSASETDRDDLTTLVANLSECSASFRQLIDGVTLVPQLRETRVFAGFSRLIAQPPVTAPESLELLWRNPPENSHSQWLPATLVYGEGIFIRLRQDTLISWEENTEIVNRISRLNRHYADVVTRRNWRALEVSPRLVLIHTLAHLLINRLVYECGYSSASLRERLYVSTRPGKEMAGLLIYTSSGDSDGTLGGLVRAGQPSNLERILFRALEEARWCSADPVCQENGTSGGQGPESLNLAACHSCSLLPETSCEHFNRFLDRATVVGDLSGVVPGYFADCL